MVIVGGNLSLFWGESGHFWGFLAWRQNSILSGVNWQSLQVQNHHKATINPKPHLANQSVRRFYKICGSHVLCSDHIFERKLSPSSELFQNCERLQPECGVPRARLPGSLPFVFTSSRGKSRKTPNNLRIFILILPSIWWWLLLYLFWPSKIRQCCFNPPPGGRMYETHPFWKQASKA